MNINNISLKDLRPSQFYISEKKLRDVEAWFDAGNLSGFKAIPVKMLDGIPVMTDGHTRAVAALRAGLDSVPLIWDEDDLDWDMYRACVKACEERKIFSPADLLSRIISEEDYRVKWDKWCDIMQAEVRRKRNMEKDMNMEFEGKVAVVTGGASGIGKAIAEEFSRLGAAVEVIDLKKGDHYVGDISKRETLEAFADYVIKKHGKIDFLINNALPLMKGIDTCSYEEFSYALAVGVTAPFYLTKLFAPYFAKGAGIINISSSRDRMSQPQTESYTAAKGGIAALTHALAVSLSGKVRVNSISPGWIDTDYTVYEGPDAVQQPAGRVGNPMDIAYMVMYLCSEKAGFITGENICIDGGMTKLMIYHGDHGWTLDA